MREIKFRAYVRHMKCLVPVINIDFDNKEVLADLSEGQGDYSGYHLHEIELMQFTGLKDENNREIYEGDILNDYGGTQGIVFYHNGAFRLSSNIVKLDLRDPQSYDDLNGYLIHDHGLNVIGNRWEHPHLLEGSVEE